MQNCKKMVILLVVASVFIVSEIVLAGNLEPSSPPGSTMHSMEDIYTKQDTTQSKVDAVEAKLDVLINALTKTPEDVALGTTFLGLRDDGTIGEMTGTNTCSAGKRFFDRGDGTIQDCNSGLIWLKDANEMGYKSWADARTAAANLSDGEHGLTDGSSDGDWRIPTKAEWKAFVVKTFGENPALCNAAGDAQWSQGDAFTDVVQSGLYWSSTESGSIEAWQVDIDDGNMYVDFKTYTFFIWPVRSGN